MITPPERSAERDAAIEALLPQVSFDGWTMRALRNGLLAAGQSADDADLLFPGGAADMIEAFCDWADRRMEEETRGKLDGGLHARVRAVIAARLRLNAPHREAVRRAVAVLALPRNTRLAARITGRTVDAIFHAAGDTSADFSWYTKRAILTAIYTSTLLFWLSDSTEDNAATLAFLDRRLAQHARMHRASRRIMGRLNRLPGLRAAA